VLDDASGKWGIRVTRVEIKAIDPPKSVVDAMEKQMRAEREKRAAILNAEGVKQAKILTAEGEKQGAILTAEGAKQSAILRAEGQAEAIGQVFQSIHSNDPDPKLLAYQYLQTLPELAKGAGNTFWVIPSEVTTALKAVTSAFDGKAAPETASASEASLRSEAPRISEAGTPTVTAGSNAAIEMGKAALASVVSGASVVGGAGLAGEDSDATANGADAAVAASAPDAAEPAAEPAAEAAPNGIAAAPR
jgi:SPFH domain / Band 7 family